MKPDHIVEETRRLREAYAAQFGQETALPDDVRETLIVATVALKYSQSNSVRHTTRSAGLP